MPSFVRRTASYPTGPSCPPRLHTMTRCGSKVKGGMIGPAARSSAGRGIILGFLGTGLAGWFKGLVICGCGCCGWGCCGDGSGWSASKFTLCLLIMLIDRLRPFHPGVLGLFGVRGLLGTTGLFGMLELLGGTGDFISVIWRPLCLENLLRRDGLRDTASWSTGRGTGTV